MRALMMIAVGAVAASVAAAQRRYVRGRGADVMGRTRLGPQPQPDETPQQFAARLDRLMRTCHTCGREHETVGGADACELGHEHDRLDAKRAADGQRSRPVY